MYHIRVWRNTGDKPDQRSFPVKNKNGEIPTFSTIDEAQDNVLILLQSWFYHRRPPKFRRYFWNRIDWYPEEFKDDNTSMEIKITRHNGTFFVLCFCIRELETVS